MSNYPDGIDPMDCDYAHDTCSMFTNGLYKYEAVIKMFDEHRKDVLKDALANLYQTLEYRDCLCKSDQWCIDCRKKRAEDAILRGIIE